MAGCTRISPQNGGPTDSRAGAMNKTSPAGFRASTTHHHLSEATLSRVEAREQASALAPR